MRKRFHRFVDSVVFAGLRPDAPREQAKRMPWLGPLRGLLERVLSRPAPSDPLYLSNRTFDQKAMRGLAIAVPCLILAGVTALGLSRIFHANGAGPAAEPSAAELASKLLPNFDKNIRVEVNQDVQVLDAHVEHEEGGTRVSGTVKNNTDHLIHTTEIVFSLTDQIGSQLGAVAAQVDNLAPKATAKFQFAVEQKDAAVALVREVQTR
jgi:hypothetical protein